MSGLNVFHSNWANYFGCALKIDWFWLWIDGGGNGGGGGGSLCTIELVRLFQSWARWCTCSPEWNKQNRQQSVAAMLKLNSGLLQFQSKLDWNRIFRCIAAVGECWLMYCWSIWRGTHPLPRASQSSQNRFLLSYLSAVCRVRIIAGCRFPWNWK